MLDQTESRSKRWGSNMAKGFAVAGAAAAAGIGGGLKKAADAAIEAEKAQASMVAQLKASGISYGKHADEIDRVIQKHSQLSGLDDEDLQRSFTNIVRVTGDVDKSLRLTGLAADFARAKHIDVAKAGEIVGKVAGGNTGILSRYGIQVEKGASAQEALAALQSKFAGQAEAYGKTTQGAMDRASVASENLGEAVGAKLTPFLAKAAGAMVDVLEWTERTWPKVKKVIGGAVDAVVGFVRRFRERNREDIASVVEAVQRVGRFFKRVFEDVVVPAVERALPHIKDAIEGILKVIRGLVRVVTGIINGDWSKAWDGMKDIVSGGLRAARGAVRASFELFGRIMSSLGKKIIGALVDALKGLGEAVKDKVVAEVKKGLGNAIPLLTNPIGALGNKLIDGIGDGVGKAAGDGLGFMGGSAGASGAGLMGADFDLGPFARIGASAGLHVTSGLRPGSITSSGNVSYHSSGDAIDMGGSMSGMRRAATVIRNLFGSRIRELISPFPELGIKDGRPFRYSGAIQAQHSGSNAHVHVAYTGPFGDGIGDIRSLWTRAGGSAARANLAAAVAMAESGGDPRAFNRNSDGSVDRGLWQINSVHGALSTFDRLGNARAAVRISGGGRDWSPWVAFTNGSYQRFLTGGGGGGGRGSSSLSARARFVAARQRARNRSAAAVQRASTRGPFTPRGPLNSFTGRGFSPNDGTPWWERELPETSAGDVSDPALEENNRLLAENNALLQATKANQDLILKLGSQGPQIVAAVVAAVNGGIGGRLGLGFQSPGFAGGVARY